MCGIVAYIGRRQASDILLEGLKRLEYRGYDSAGVAVMNGGLKVARSVGRVANVEKLIQERGGFKGTIGIAHTRWATHGGVTERNAHPHRDDEKLGHGIAIIHNGIIENYASIKKYLEEKGHVFHGETDTEVLAHLIGELYAGDLEKAVQAALREVTGAYAIAVVCEKEPDVLVVARKGSPLMVGVGNGEYVVASDASAIVSHTTQAIALNDYSVARITREGFRTTTVDNIEITAEIRELEFDLEQIELGHYDHFMLKEIFEQPRALRQTLQGRVDVAKGEIRLGGVGEHARKLANAKRVVFVGQGTALHACMIGKYLFEDLAKVHAEHDFASEFRYRNPIVEDGTVVIAVSQSGETADTLAALQEAKQRGALALGVVNVVGSSISRETDAGVYLRVGPEIGVASTKAFTGQVAVLLLMALKLGRGRRLSRERGLALAAEIARLPELIEAVLRQDAAIAKVASSMAGHEHAFFLGRGPMHPVALEGALKLKEISYIHAEGYHAAELKHGPIALLTPGMPVVVLANRSHVVGKTLGNAEECKARGARIIAVVTEGGPEAAIADDVIRIPDCDPLIATIPAAVALQLLAYQVARHRGCPIDQPRNLAKSVTVE